MEELAPELVQYIGFRTTLGPIDVVNFALTSHRIHHALFGAISSPHPYDQAQGKALGGVVVCAKAGWWDAALLAVRRGCGDPCGSNNLPLRKAAKAGIKPLVVALLAAGADPTVARNAPIRFAALRGHAEVVDLLLDAPGVDPAAHNNDALVRAAEYGHLDVVNRLLADDRVDPRAQRNLAIRSAAKNGHVGVVGALLEDDRVDPGEGFPLLDAARLGHAEVVRILLGNPGVDPKARNSRVANIAVQFGHLDVFNVLIDDGRVDFGKSSAFSNAVILGHTEMVRILLAHPDLDLDLLGDSVTDAIETALARNHRDVIALLHADPRFRIQSSEP